MFLIQRRTRVVVSEHVVEFVAVVGRRIKFVEAQLVLIVNGCAAAEEPVVFEVLVVVVVAIQLILHQVKRDLLMNYLANFLYYDRMVTSCHLSEAGSKTKLESFSALMGVVVGPGGYPDFERRRKVHSFPALNLLLREQ